MLFCTQNLELFGAAKRFVTCLTTAALFFVVIGCSTVEPSSEPSTELPKTKDNAQASDDNRIIVDLQVDGRVKWGSKVMTAESLQIEMQKLAEMDRDWVVLLRVDSQLLYSGVLPVLESINSAGFETVHLVAYKEDE
ncbi:MAG: ExbD/TolR family protein [Phycisphaeraceae bacterium]